MGLQEIIENVNASVVRTDHPRVDVGDTVNLHLRIVEGAKERVQVFQGVVLGRSGRGVNEMITVRRIVENMGVERIVPINSPKLAKIEVVRRGDARRAKLYYLRDRAGRSRRLRDRRRGAKHLVEGGAEFTETAGQPKPSAGAKGK
ncbi:MAG TPA: 50S ribosomal protein L19 [Phycisphaerales bacterium]|nr:50S ribosomal protein L19 [Phycisphaerales bacterium]